MTTLDIQFSPWQQEVWNYKARFKIVAAGRRTGKTIYAINEMLLRAMDGEPGDIGYIAPTAKQAKKILWNEFMRIGKPIIKSWHINDGEIHLINGVTVHIYSADNPDNIRGIKLKYLVLDEYADIKEHVWDEILRPTLMDYAGHALFIGTPKGRNHFYELFLKGLSDDPQHDSYMSWHFTSYDNPFIKHEEIEEAKKTSSSHAFRQEYMASFESKGNENFAEDWIIIDENEPLGGEWLISVDLAGFPDGTNKKKHKRLDDTAISIVKVGEYGWYVKDIIHGRWGVKETAQKIFHAVKKYQPAKIGIEKGTLKQAVQPYIMDLQRKHNIYFRITETTHGNQRKTDRIIWAIQGLFENKKVRLNKGSWNAAFIDQLLQFPNPLVHDDMVDSLAYIAQLAKTTYADTRDFTYDFVVQDDILGM